MLCARWLALGLALACCGGEGHRVSAPEGAKRTPSASTTAVRPRPDITLSVLALNDLHGRITALPVFAGYVNNVREVRERDGGGVVVLDAGDMFQGSLESNLTEGASVFAAYHALGMSAVALGNHEFDFGPVGDSREGDPQGALKQRLLEASFPVLSVNLVTSGGSAPGFRGLSPSALLDVAGVKVGIVGALTVSTPEIVMPSFFSGLGVAPVAPLLTEQARALRASGAKVVLAALHLGADCRSFDDPYDLSSCSKDREVFDLVEALPEHTLDGVVAGHTHAGVAHFVKGVPVVEAYSRGRAFARLDLLLDGTTHELKGSTVYPPHDLCPNFDQLDCTAGEYEGRAVVPDAEVAAAILPGLEKARDKRSQLLGPELKRAVLRDHGRESALGNLFVDLLLAGADHADAAILNGGGFRADLPPGPLTYGSLYEAMPFDNRVAKVRISGRELARVLSVHLSHDDHGIVSLAGLWLRARCRDGELQVELRRSNGRRVEPDEMLTVATSDYLATGGDRLFEVASLSKDRIDPDLGLALRDAFALELARSKHVDPETLLHPKRPRLDLPAPRPLDCSSTR
jgi:2',3'-cyclic-nucleotide 2'-phosphodiesterase (5'-nucleotidase family)